MLSMWARQHLKEGQKSVSLHSMEKWQRIWPLTLMIYWDCVPLFPKKLLWLSEPQTSVQYLPRLPDFLNKAGFLSHQHLPLSCLLLKGEKPNLFSKYLSHARFVLWSLSEQVSSFFHVKNVLDIWSQIQWHKIWFMVWQVLHHWVRKISWGRERRPTPVELPRELHGQRSLCPACAAVCGIYLVVESQGYSLAAAFSLIAVASLAAEQTLGTQAAAAGSVWA